jgi:hypothetical protein
VVTEPIESLIPKIVKRYNNRPVGWNVLRDYKGNFLVLGPSDGYMLKMIPLNPQEHTGVGTKIDDSDELRRLVEGAPSYGFRPLSTKQTERLLNSFRQGEKQHRLISKLLEKNPVSIPELEKKKPKAVLNGPFIGHPDLSTISESQRELEAKLKIESLKLFKKKYPYRASIYG